MIERKKKKMKNFVKIFLIPILFCFLFTLHGMAISTDDLDLSGDIGYVRMKIFVENAPKELLVHVCKEDTGEIIDMYTYPQYDYVIDATLPVGTYSIQDVMSEENLEFDVNQEFTIEPNGIVTVKIPQSNVTFENFDEPLSSDGIGSDIALLTMDDGNEIVDQEIGNDVVQPRTMETSSDNIIEKTKTIRHYLSIGSGIVGLILCGFVIMKKRKTE